MRQNSSDTSCISRFTVTSCVILGRKTPLMEVENCSK